MSTHDAQVRPFFTALRDRWWIVALCAITAASITFVTVKRQPGQYEAGTLLGLKNQYLDRDIFNLSAAAKTIEETLAQQPGQLDTNAAVIELTQRLGLQPATDARDIGSATSVALDSKFFLPVVNGRDADPERAKLLADEFARVIVEQRQKADKRRITQTLRATEERLEEVTKERVALADEDQLLQRESQAEMARLTSRVLRLRLMLQFRPKTVSIVRWAPMPTTRTRPPALNLSIFAGLFGVMMGCALLAWRELRDRRPRAAEVAQDLRAAIITDLPRTSLLPGARPRGPHAGEIAALEAVQRVIQSDEPHSVVGVTEAITLGRASAVARLLAETAALGGARVLLATNDPHVADATIDGLEIQSYPIEIGETARSWLASRREAYDLVVVNLPSPVGSAAALEFASLADRVIAVWLPDSIDRRQLMRFGRTLNRADVRLAGVVRVGGQAA
ncbi:MAG: hypothetical protein JHD16_06290 [Solirubrobacteraceae bacterium]|nr:hypothetical protein [Solirubrobacteraceae bacterium]